MQGTAFKSVASLCDQAVVSGTNFLTGVIVGRSLPKEQFGLYMLAFSIALLALNAQNALISAPYMVYSPRMPDDERAPYAGSSLIHGLGLSALSVAALLVFTLVLSSGVGPAGLAPVVSALAVAVTFMILRDMVRRLCFAHLRVLTALLADSQVAVLQVGGLWVLMRREALTAGRSYLVTGLACGAAAAVGLFAVRGLLALQVRRAASDFLHNWRSGKWLGASALAQMATAELYPWFLAAFHSTETAAELAACRIVVYFANPFLMGITNFLGPQAAHAYAEGRPALNRIVRRFTVLAFAAMCGFFVAILFLGEWLLRLIYDGKYSGHGSTVTILALHYVLASLNRPVNCGLMAIERSDVVFRSYLLAGAVTLGLGVPLVYFVGVNGAAWALVATTAVTAAFRHWVFWRGTEKSHNVDD